MTFVQVEFPIFLAIVFVAYWALRDRVWQNRMLWVASWIFYGWVHPWFLALLAVAATVDYFAAIYIERYPEQKKALLLVSIGTNLTMLGYFKYYNFFVENMQIALGSLGLDLNFSTLNIILPVGISFYTFQTMSYTFDVYKGKLKACEDYTDYMLYVSFFPQLVAGPIERAANLLGQVQKDRTFNLDLVLSGFGLAMWGAFKKICIADTIAPYVDEVFMTREPAFIMVLMAGFGFGVQMLADFAAYTDLARGSARMLGFDLVQNFDRPYQAYSTPEFWRRWHISLSTWVGDYVYTPLLRSGKPSAMRTIGALMTTFFLVGLWHGASWKFILLGLYNGFWMCVYTFGTPLVPRAVRYNLVAGFFAWLFHTLVVLQVTGLLFREVSVARVWQHLTQPVFQASQEQLAAAAIVGSMALLGTLPINISYYVEDYLLPRLRETAWWLPIQTTFWSFEALAIFVFYRDASQDFIYFQF